MAVIASQKDTTRTFIFAPLFTRFGTFLLYGFLIAVGIIYIYPFLWMLGSSLKTPGEFFTQGLSALPAGPPQWSNYLAAWEGARFGRYFLNTVVVATISTTLVILITSAGAFALTRLNMPGRRFFLAAIAITFFLPRGYTILPVFEIVRELGLLNTLSAIIIVSTSGGLIFQTFLFYGYLRTIPREIEEAAIIDGATIFQRYWRVILPLAMPMIATVALFEFMSNWNDFFTPLVFTLGRPELRTLAVGMYAFVGENSRDWTLMCAERQLRCCPSSCFSSSCNATSSKA
jgi:raffinose/stachyose/melibiose transport system permease protein